MYLDLTLSNDTGTKTDENIDKSVSTNTDAELSQSRKSSDNSNDFVTTDDDNRYIYMYKFMNILSLCLGVCVRTYTCMFVCMHICLCVYAYILVCVCMIEIHKYLVIVNPNHLYFF